MGKNLEGKRQLILDYDQVFVERLAVKIFKKPQLSIWMILIPIIFVFFFQQVTKYKNDKKDFIKNYLLSPNRALNEAYEAIKQKREVSIESMVEMADLKPFSNAPYRNLMSVLTQHYINLMNAKGDLYGQLILSAYPEKVQYQQMMGDINKAWKSLSESIVEDLIKSTPEAANTVRKIEDTSVEIRNEDINVFY